MGPGDNFLQLVTKTRNQKGIACNSAIVANFGLEWDGEVAAASGEGEPAAKKMKGALDNYFVCKNAAAPPSNDDPSGGLSPGADGMTPEENEKAEREAAENAAKEKEKADKEAAEKHAKGKPSGSGGDGLQVGQVLSDGAKVVAIVPDGGHESALLWRSEGAGSLSLRASTLQTSNKKITPKTTLWKVPGAKCGGEGGMDDMTWTFANTKALVHNASRNVFLTLGEMAKEKGALGVAKHAPAFAVTALLWCVVGEQDGQLRGHVACLAGWLGRMGAWVGQ